MKNITIPIVPVDISALDLRPQIGPNSQPTDEDEYGYLPLPSGMTTFDLPYVRHSDDPEAVRPAVEVLSAVLEALDAWEFGVGDNPVFDLTLLSRQALVVVNEAFGQGEVSVIMRGDTETHIQETVFAGLWRVQTLGADGRVVSDYIEAGAIPRVVVEASASEIAVDVSEPQAPLVDGMMNARPVLFELLAAARVHKPGDKAHVVNLSLLPMTPSDLSWLGEALGIGAVTILSRGYGNCRITLAKWPWVWRVQYFNNDDKLILDMVEVTDVPEVALAAAEDMMDTRQRLAEWIDVLRDGIEMEPHSV